ncbi:right-handed parallel beta-helix repeat-containing protein [Geitlerinema calcuttense]|uniref:Right-handed parallel beta-helix repeat-containing protein n=1 Tax=Geitlerinema calcuttense NRMC-F 0142 TaxID=2922238 RepID=A0ABT7M0J9_9CYAN|nr:right-handed parallel beta-helix repeat-containing protein [Geitlerinema calcuttense]MDL5057789.1 right-handed parallel beta-helix repeat-containing protein [Geitlerinema calcuttense NRMC-F 0142]
MATFTLSPSTSDLITLTPDPDIITVQFGANFTETDTLVNFSTADRIDISAYNYTEQQLQQLISGAQDLGGAVRIVGQPFSQLTLSGITFSQFQAAGSSLFIRTGADITAPTAPLPVQAEAFVAHTTTPSGTVVGRVQATDNIAVTQYTITGGTGPTAAFTINPNGNIILNNPAALTSTATLAVAARDAAGNQSPTTNIRIFHRIEEAVAVATFSDNINQSFQSNPDGLDAVRVAPGNYGSVTLVETAPDDGFRLRLRGPNSSVENPTWQARTNPAAGRNTEAVIQNITLLSIGTFQGIQDGITLDGFLINGGRVDLYDTNPNPGTARSNMTFRNNIFRGNRSSDPTIQIETAPGGPVSNNIVIQNNWFDGIGQLQPFQGVPQAIKLNNASNVTITENLIERYGPGVQGFGVLMQYGISNVSITNNTFDRIGVAAVFNQGSFATPPGNTVTNTPF